MKVSDVASKVAFKELSAVDLPELGSNQHEFNGASGLREFFGSDRLEVSARVVWCPDDLDDFQETTGSLTWYDARENHPSRTEYRLYYNAQCSNIVSLAGVRDSLFLIQPHTGPLTIVMAPRDSEVTRLLMWFFQAHIESKRFKVELDLSEKSDRIAFMAGSLLERIGIELPSVENDLADRVLHEFPDLLKWPTGQQLAQFVWNTPLGLDPIEDPDHALVQWIEAEYVAFRALESARLSPKVREILTPIGTVDLTLFKSLALEFQNRSKSRAGRSLELHIGKLLRSNQIQYSEQATTEDKKRPDFLFPGMTAYHDLDFPTEKLFMLGAKRTLKDRWRQVLTEAARIEKKHLLTLDPVLTSDQISAIQKEQITLVMPSTVQADYAVNMCESMMTVSDFVALMKSEQS